MRLKVALDPRRSDEAFVDAVTMVHELRDGGARVFPLPQNQQARVDKLVSIDARYGVHEYLGEHFKPLMFSDVAEAFSNAKCSYVGTAESTDHLLRLSVPRGVFDMIDATTDLVLRESMRDLSIMRSFRRDVYRRGLAPPSPTAHERSLNDFTIVGLGKAFNETFTRTVHGGSVTMTAELYQPVVEALECGPPSVAEVRHIHDGAEMSLTRAVSLVVMLIEAEFAAPEVSGWMHNGSRESTRRFNRVLIDENRAGSSHRYLVAPATGSAVDSSIMELLVIGALWDGADADPAQLTESVMNEVARQRRRVLHASGHVVDQQEAWLITRRRVERALGRAEGLLARLGVC